MKTNMKNELKINGTQQFMGIDIPVIEGGFGEKEKVILAKTIAEIHEMEVKVVNQIISRNEDEFEFGIDIIDLKQVTTCDPFLNLGFTKAQWGNAKNVYLLSEQGYMLLVGFMKTPKAKEIRKQLRREYFAMREQLKSQAPQITREQSMVLDIFNKRANPVEFALALGEFGDYKYVQGAEFVCNENTINLPRIGEMLLSIHKEEFEKLNYNPLPQVLGGEFVKYLTRQGYYEKKYFRTMDGKRMERMPHSQPTQLFYDIFVAQGMAIAREVGTGNKDNCGKITTIFTNNIYKFLTMDTTKETFLQFTYNTHPMLVDLMKMKNGEWEE